MFPHHGEKAQRDLYYIQNVQLGVNVIQSQSQEVNNGKIPKILNPPANDTKYSKKWRAKFYNREKDEH